MLADGTAIASAVVVSMVRNITSIRLNPTACTQRLMADRDRSKRGAYTTTSSSGGIGSRVSNVSGPDRGRYSSQGRSSPSPRLPPAPGAGLPGALHPSDCHLEPAQRREPGSPPGRYVANHGYRTPGPRPSADAARWGKEAVGDRVRDGYSAVWNGHRNTDIIARGVTACASFARRLRPGAGRRRGDRAVA